MSEYTREQVIEMATNVRDCAWPADVKEYMVLIEPMLRAYAATLRQQASEQGMREEIRRMAGALEEHEWADSLSTDPDVARLDAAISAALAQNTQGEVPDDE